MNTILRSNIPCLRSMGFRALQGLFSTDGILLNLESTLFRSPSLHQPRPVKSTTFCVLASRTSNKTFVEHQRAEKSSQVVVYKDVVPLGAQLSTFFHHLPTKDAHAWTTMMASCNQHGDFVNAIEIFYIMQAEGVKAEKEAIVAALNAVTGLRDFEEGRRLHSLVKEMGLEAHISVGSALMNMYGKVGALGEACNAFEKIPVPDAVAWTAIIGAYCDNGTYGNVMELLEKMSAENISPTEATYVTIVSSCRMKLEEAKILSSRIAATVMHSSIPVATAIIKMFANLGDLVLARESFEKIPEKNSIIYAAIMRAFLNKKLTTETIRYFHHMVDRRIPIDAHTCAAALRAAALGSELEDGETIHRTAIQYGLDKDPMVQSSLINMYGSCGKAEDARAIFEMMKPWSRDTEAYSAMIGTYGKRGECDEALRIARRMEQEGAHMNEESFLYVLKACAGNANLTKLSYAYFRSMIFDYGFTASVKHYDVMIDCVGRSGSPKDTEALMNALKVASDEVLRREAKALEKNKVIRELMPGYLKKEGVSSITIDNVVHSFCAGDRSHPYAKEIYQEIGRLHELITREGYVPNTSSVRHNVTERQKANLLKAHSERLAIAYANMNTEAGSTLRIMKNLRVCEDCHNACKLFAKVLGRELVMRDYKRFHHVSKDGTCSCNDYW